jgi:hypothetical protein
MNNIKKNLFDLFEIDKMPPEKGIEFLERLAKLVFQAVLVRVLPLLSEEDFSEYEKIVSSQDDNGDILFKFWYSYFACPSTPLTGKLFKEDINQFLCEIIMKNKKNQPY